MKKEWSRFLVLPALLLLAAFLTAAPALAAQQPLIDLGYSDRYSRTYTKYDIDSDGKPDKISIGLGDKQEEGYYMKLIVRVNGKAALTKRYTYDGTFGATVKLITLKGGKVFIYIRDNVGDANSVCALFKYNGSKLVKMFDFRTLNGLFPAGQLEYVNGVPKSVTSNTITFSEGFQCAALAYAGTDMKIVYKSGKFKLATRYVKMNGINGTSAGKRYKLVTGVTAYPTATATKVARNFSKGTLLRVTQLVIGNGFLRFRVVNNAGRYGYLNINRAATVDGVKVPLFEGLDYAG